MSDTKQRAGIFNSKSKLWRPRELDQDLEWLRNTDRCLSRYFGDVIHPARGERTVTRAAQVEWLLITPLKKNRIHDSLTCKSFNFVPSSGMKYKTIRNRNFDGLVSWSFLPSSTFGYSDLREVQRQRDATWRRNSKKGLRDAPDRGPYHTKHR